MIFLLVFMRCLLACLHVASEHSRSLRVSPDSSFLMCDDRFSRAGLLVSPQDEGGREYGSHHEIGMWVGMLLLASPMGAAALRAVALKTVMSSRATKPHLSLLDEPAFPKPPAEEVVRAVEALVARRPNARLTVADLAAEGGVDLSTARTGLAELASALAGASGVSVAASDRGELLYSFPKALRSELSSRSSAAKAREAWRTVQPALSVVGRVAFGLALFASIAVVFAAITVLTSSSQSEGKGERRGNTRGGYGVLGGGNMGFGDGFGPSPLDLFLPRRNYRYYGWFAPPPRMSLPEAIFSFVFGDGDPNQALRAARLRGLADVIKRNGGAALAEQLAPYSDPPPPNRVDETVDETLVDESWVLPAVVELGGRQEVSEDGTIVYVFDDLTVSSIASDANLVLADPALADLEILDETELAELARERRVELPDGTATDGKALRRALRTWAAQTLAQDGGGGSGGSGGGALFPQGFLEEKVAPFSSAEPGQLVAAGLLGLVNLGGVAFLGTLLADLPAGAVFPEGLEWLGLVQALFPALALYAGSFIALPALRYVRLQRRNKDIEQRNRNRAAWQTKLEREGVAPKRLEAAKRFGRTLRIVREDNVAFDSAKSLTEQQGAMQAPALDDFDRRLRESGGGTK